MEGDVDDVLELEKDKVDEGKFSVVYVMFLSFIAGVST